MPGAYIPFIIATTTSPQVPPTSPLTSPGVFSLILLLLWRPDTTISWSDGRTQLTHVFVQGMEKRGAQGSANSKKNHATLEPPFCGFIFMYLFANPSILSHSHFRYPLAFFVQQFHTFSKIATCLFMGSVLLLLRELLSLLRRSAVWGMDARTDEDMRFCKHFTGNASFTCANFRGRLAADLAGLFF